MEGDQGDCLSCHGDEAGLNFLGTLPLACCWEGRR